jgi:tetratricopeptide (TPR) repeat protein
MNNTLESSHLVSLNSNSNLHESKSNSQLERPTLQQKQAIAQIYVEQAWIYFQERNWRDAIAACKNALYLNPQNADAYKIFGNILKINGKKAQALGLYAKALEINPNSATIYANLGSFHADQQNWQQALDYYQRAVIIDPAFAGAYRSLARIWEELGESDKALECLCQAINLEPAKFSATEYFDFGDRLYREGKLKEASIFYIHGVKLNPQEKAQLVKLVKILEKLEEWQQAVIFYHQLISLSTVESADGNLAVTKPIKHLLSKANSVAQSGLQRKVPKNTQTKHQVATTALQAISSSDMTGKLRHKSAQHQQSLLAAAQPNSASSWNNLGNSYAQKQQWVKAISCYQEAVELDPNLSKTHRNLAQAYYKIDKKDRAIICWYEAFNLEPDGVKPQEHFSLARQLVKLKQVDKAIACLRHAIKLDPNFAQAESALGKLLKNQKSKAVIGA